MSVLDRSGAPGRSRDEAGMALIMTLWILTAVAAMMAPLAVGARQEGMRGLRAVEDVTLRAAIDAALARALAEIAADRWDAGEERRWHWEGVGLRYRITGESGRVDLNAASPAALEALFAAHGLDGATAETLRERLLARRRVPEAAADGGRAPGDPTDAGSGPLRHPAELRPLLEELPGADPSLFGRMLPDITVWTAAPVPAAHLARPAVRAQLERFGALSRQGQTGETPAGGRDPAAVYRIDIRAELQGGAARRTLAVVARTADGWRIREWMAPLALEEGSDE